MAGEHAGRHQIGAVGVDQRPRRRGRRAGDRSRRAAPRGERVDLRLDRLRRRAGTRPPASRSPGADRCGSTRSTRARPAPGAPPAPCPAPAAGSSTCAAAGGRLHRASPARPRAPSSISSSPAADSGRPRRAPFSTTNTAWSQPLRAVRTPGRRPAPRRTAPRPARSAARPPLPSADEQPPLAGVDVLAAASRAPRSGAARPAASQHHRPVALRAQRAQQRVDLGRRQHPRQRPRACAPAAPRPGHAARPAAGQPGRAAPDCGPRPRRRGRTDTRYRPAHARQPPGDRPRRQPRLTVLDPHDPLPAARGALRGQEREHVRRGHLRRLLADHLEEHLQVIRHRQPRVGPRPRRHELQVVIHQRMPERDLPRSPPSAVERARHGMNSNG